MKNYWVDRRQVIGFIGAVFIIFSIFLPFYQINLLSFGQATISLADIPFIGSTIAFIIVLMGIISIVALAFEEYSLLYLTGFVTLALVLIMFIFSEVGFIVLSGSLPVIISRAVNYLIDYDFGWVVLFAGSGFLIIVPKLS